MGKIKSFFSDKGRVGVFIVCLMLLSISLVSSVLNETYAAGDSYTVKYDANGGAGAPAAETWTIGTSGTIGSKPSTNKAGHSFTGWLVTEDTGKLTANTIVQPGSTYNFSSIVTAYGSSVITLVAQWKRETYTVVYDANGGTGAPANETWTAGTSNKVSDTIPKRGNYTFVGWMVNGDSNTTVKSGVYSAFDNFIIDGKVTLKAKWGYTVKYDANGGTGAPADETWILGVSKTISTVEPTNGEYVFGGWIDAENTATEVIVKNDGTTKYNFDAHASDGVVTLKAKWNYTVEYNANGGAGAPAAETWTVDVSKKVSETVPIRNGYTFNGWMVNGNSNTTVNSGTYSTFDSFVNDGKVVLTAKWTANSYTVKYDANGGTGAPAAETWTIGESKKISSTGPKWGNLKFAGWIVTEDTGKLTANTIVQPGSTYNFDSIITAYGSSVITLKAKWTYILRYDANGGTGAPADETWTIGESKIINNTIRPTRNGHTFNGWVLETSGYDSDNDNPEVIVESDGKTKYNFDAPAHVTTVLSDGVAVVTLKAIWSTESSGGDTGEDTGGGTVSTYTVTYISNGGTGTMSSSSYTSGVSKSLSKNVFVRTGYTFKGWNTNADGSGTAYNDGQSITVSKNLTLYAQWKVNTYSVKYDKNGGTGTMSNSSHTYGTAKKLTTNTFTRTGYVFNGWNTKADGSGDSYTDSQSVTNLSSTNGAIVTLYAQWKANTYSVKYDKNGGTGTMSNSSHTYGTAKKLTTNTFTRTGYVFNGWNTKADGSGTSYTDGQSVTNLSSTNGAVVTLYAQWITEGETSETVIYYVKYDSNGGTGTMSNSKHTYKVVSNLADNTFVREGYVFKGWNTKADGSGTNYTDGQAVTNLSSTNGAVVTLYAQWKANTYSVKYDKNGGTGTMSNSSHTYGTAKSLTKNTFTRTGYVFNGWNTKADGSGDSYIDGQSVTNLSSTNGTIVTLYAQWKANTYNVKYDKNGGTGTMSNSSHTYGTAKKLTTNTFTRTGYVFNGWNTKADGSGISYTDGQSVTNLSSTNGATVTLYAQWITEGEASQTVIYYVKYDANGGTGTMPNSEHKYGILSNLAANTFVREGYVFTGWNTKSDGSGTSYADGQAVSKLADSNGEVVTLYAQWITEEEFREEDNNDYGDGDVGNNDGNDSGNNKPSGSDNIDESPKTGSLPIILVSLIGVVAFITFVIYHKKVRI